MTKCSLCGLVLASLAAAWMPPTDTAGPITAEMQPPAVGAYGAGGYADLSRPDVPCVIPVSVRNSGDLPVSGTVRVAGIDGWKVDPASVPFRVGPRGRWRGDFSVTFPRSTYNAHYPIHAYVEFEYGGRTMVAHPILIVQPKLADVPRLKLPVEYKPVPATGSFWRSPVRRESAEIVNVGAEAGQTARETYDVVQIFQYTARGITMTLGPRPPAGRETVESAAVEYPISLPGAPTGLGFSVRGPRGATFTIKVNGTIVWQGTEAAPIDLSRYANTDVRLRFEARGGAGDVQWIEPSISVHGSARAAAPRPLGTAGDCSIAADPDSVSFQCGSRILSFRGFHFHVAGEELIQPLSVADEFTAGHLRSRRHYLTWAGEFDIVADLWVEAGAFKAAFKLENAPPTRPWFAVYLESVSAGEWSESVDRVYAGAGNVLVHPKSFRLGYDGHSLSTSFVGFDFANGVSVVQNSTAIPDALEFNPAQHIASLVVPHAQTMEFYPAPNVFAAVKALREADRRQPSAGVAKLAGRFTFDLWGGRYAESARALDSAADYGLKDALVVWHNWQRWGYDYRLPDIYPPNPQLGSEADFRALSDACARAGTLFAPHDNYIDFYPDSDGFTFSNIVFRQNGTPMKAWFNYGREAQAYRARPDRLRPFLERNVNLLKDAFSPTAYFIDVWSSAPPYDYWTADGAFVERGATQRAWGESFAWIRDRLGNAAPQISEAGHDKLIGWLDGADAQQLRVDPKAASFTWKIDAEDSERIPWIDVAWHDRFILHGAGYEGRYQASAYSDDYLSTEVLSGRPAMVAQPFNRDVVRVYWLLDGVMHALARDRIAGVEFDAGNIHRQHVSWEKGGEAWVNRGADPWTVAGHVLPQYGFYVKAGAAEAAIEMQGARRVEWSRSPAGRYEEGRWNGRPLPD